MHAEALTINVLISLIWLSTCLKFICQMPLILLLGLSHEESMTFLEMISKKFSNNETYGAEHFGMLPYQRSFPYL